MNEKFAKIQDCCLEQATDLLNDNAAMTEGTAKAAKVLIEAACTIEMLNLHWAEQTRSGAAVYPAQPWGGQ